METLQPKLQDTTVSYMWGTQLKLGLMAVSEPWRSPGDGSSGYGEGRFDGPTHSASVECTMWCHYHNICYALEIFEIALGESYPTPDRFMPSMEERIVVYHHGCYERAPVKHSRWHNIADLSKECHWIVIFSSFPVVSRSFPRDITFRNE